VNLIRKAKFFAAEHDTNINTIVWELLEGDVSRDERAQLGSAAATSARRCRSLFFG
jgi:hypothetical protein